MPLYPIFLNLKNTRCLVIGGGRVAERKIKTLIESGADVTVVSPIITKEIQKLAKAKKIRHTPHCYRRKDLEGFFLAISATGLKEINEKIYKEAKNLGVLLNVADDPKLSNFFVPSIVQRGNLQIAVSTSGKSPYLAKAIREALEQNLPKELSTFVDIIGEVRNKLLKEKAKNGKKIRIYRSLINSPILQWIRNREKAKIESFLKGLLGKGYALSALGVKF